MRIVIILIFLLLTGSGLYLCNSSSKPKSTNVVIKDIGLENSNIGQMCTSTACMKNTDLPTAGELVAESAVTMEKEMPEQPKAGITSVAQQVTKIIPETKTLVQTSSLKKYTEFVNPSGFVNSKPFALADYIGKKVILVEFITYSCINCQRTFPYLKQWHEMYAKDGLLVIGIHTPEFAYEQDRDNVIAAMQKEGITFPIVQDNDYKTWNAYANRFWPHRYLIDYTGAVVFDHIGEGGYVETEDVIKLLLANKPDSL